MIHLTHWMVERRSRNVGKQKADPVTASGRTQSQMISDGKCPFMVLFEYFPRPNGLFSVKQKVETENLGAIVCNSMGFGLLEGPRCGIKPRFRLFWATAHADRTHTYARGDCGVIFSFSSTRRNHKELNTEGVRKGTKERNKNADTAASRCFCAIAQWTWFTKGIAFSQRCFRCSGHWISNDGGRKQCFRGGVDRILSCR